MQGGGPRQSGEKWDMLDTVASSRVKAQEMSFIDTQGGSWPIFGIFIVFVRLLCNVISPID